MNKTEESSLWKWLRDGTKCFGNSLHWERIENIANTGTPDVMGCIISVTFSLELKSIKRPKNSGTPLHIGVTTDQGMWALSRAKAGGKHWFLICVGGDKRYLVSGRHAYPLAGPIAEATLSGLSIKYGTSAYELVEWIRRFS